MTTDLVLIKLDAARTALAEAKTIQETKQVLDIASAAEIYAKRQHLGDEAIKYATSIKVEALAQLGRMLKETPRARPAIGSIVIGNKREPMKDTERPTLEQLGLDKKTSKLAQDIAELSEEQLEKVKAGVITISKAQKQTQAEIRQKERDILAEAGSHIQMTGDNYKLYCADFRKKCLEFEPNSIATIITDPPYDQESVSLYSDLGEASARLLKEGGSLLVMSGNMYLPDLLNSLSSHLNYQWQIAFLMGTGTSRVWQRKVCQMWKPILWFVKGEYTGDWVVDLFHSVKPEKALHNWQQPESVSAWLIERFSQPHDVLLDPMMGTGTNGIEAIRLGRYFIGIDISEDNVNITKGRFNA